MLCENAERKRHEKISFTEKRVAELAAPAKAYAIYRDADTDNLAVRVTAPTKKRPDGARSYVYETRVHRKNVRVTIGDVASWKLAAARTEARRLATVVDRGDDPRVEAEAKRTQAVAAHVETQRHGHVVAAVWRAYIEANKGGWGERHLADHESLAHLGGSKKKRGEGKTIAAPLAALMPLKLSDITSETVAAWLKREAKKRPTSAAGAYRLLRAFCSWTHEKPEKDKPDYRRIVALDACSASEVLKVLPPSKAKKDDKLKRGELPAWFTAVRHGGNPIIAAFLQCLLLTGARREELGGLRWADVKEANDPQWSSLVLRDKVDGKRTISLTPFVASLLRSLPRRNQWVFSSLAAEDGRLVEPTKAHNDALEGAAIQHISLHGLRRTFATLPDYLDDMPAGVVAQIMGHKPSATAEKHYKTREIDVLHKWHTKLEKWILEEAGIAFVAPAGAGRLAVVNADGSVRASNG
jgi:integrase